MLANTVATTAPAAAATPGGAATPTATPTPCAPTATSPWARLCDLAALAKPRLSMLVLCTTGVGLWLAPGQISTLRNLITMLATALVVAAANALNSYIERDIDAHMQRTRTRPLPARRLAPRTALYLGLSLAAVSTGLLLLVTNALTTILSLVAFISYVCIYTPMKQHSALAVLVGAVPGAIPPLMGWTAVTNHMDAGGLSLFALLFAWQVPHFLAIATYLRDDYANAGLQVLPVAHGERATRVCMVLSVLLLLPTSLLPVWTGVAGRIYGAVAIFLGLAFLGATLRGIYTDDVERWGRRVFRGSLIYLTILLIVLMLGA